MADEQLEQFAGQELREAVLLEWRPAGRATDNTTTTCRCGYHAIRSAISVRTIDGTAGANCFRYALRWFGRDTRNG
ncbi:hypothetical protein GCM10011588_26760 [Nocardia jinanensis]|uniref:Uncharacterized protein n=1 Tax=Nocardia jinanensis TaxID=382504 RepID=A0A917RJ60_9NOCA|nr:hypothetical protein GCM10011588_26760 [Nocardia jinanensis]